MRTAELVCVSVMTPASRWTGRADSGKIDRVQDKTATLQDVPLHGPPHRVAAVMYEGVSLLELAAAREVFGTDITLPDGRPPYEMSFCAATDSVLTDAGLRLEVPNRLDALSGAQTIVLLPTDDSEQVPDAVVSALRAARSRGARLVSLCTGAFVLAAAGLLDGHVATTHWSRCADLARRYPLVSVDPSVLYTDEGDLLTSAGSAASLDLCLHVVQRDYGTEMATKIARDLVVPLHRPGGQAQYIEAPMPALGGHDLFASTLEWAQRHLADELTVVDLAVRSAMSPRTFARRFLAATGTTPLAWLTRERVRFAQRLLETSDLPVDVVARDSGLGSPDNLRKHFGRMLRTTPQAYRRAFRPAEVTGNAGIPTDAF
jgi:transcriptional regulator GlxA family with amidase domain